MSNKPTEQELLELVEELADLYNGLMRDIGNHFVASPPFDHKLAARVNAALAIKYDSDEFYPEPEDDEGYNLAVENANAQHAGYPLKHDNDYNPY